MRTFIIGDVHGHLDRLESILLAEGIIGRCPKCDGLGEIRYLDPKLDDGDYDTWYECVNCDGDGIARIDHSVRVICLGDVGSYSEKGSPTGDMLCWRAIQKCGWVDTVLWGNHDRAVVDPIHGFKGYSEPNPATLHYIKAMYASGRLVLAASADGHLLTHAGLHKAFKHQAIDDELKTDVVKFVTWINAEDEAFLDTEKCSASVIAIRDAVNPRRGGGSDAGGIIWRDSSEKLYARWPQIFGHSKGELIRTYNNDSYCIDIGNPHNGRIAGMWLPERTFVQVNTNERDPETGAADVLRFPA